MAHFWIQKLRDKFVAVWRLAENSVDQPVHRTFYDHEPELEPDAADDSQVHDRNTTSGMKGVLRNVTEDSSWEAASAEEPVQKKQAVDLLVAVSEVLWIAGLVCVGIAILALITMPAPTGGHMTRGLNRLGNAEAFVSFSGMAFFCNVVGIVVSAKVSHKERKAGTSRGSTSRHVAGIGLLVVVWFCLFLSILR